MMNEKCLIYVIVAIVIAVLDVFLTLFFVTKST